MARKTLRPPPSRQGKLVLAWQFELSEPRSYRALKHKDIFGLDETCPEWCLEPAHDHVLEDDVKAYENGLRTAFESGVFDFDVHVRWPHGAVRWLAVRGRIVADASGAPARAIGAAVDVTKPRQEQEAEREAGTRHEFLLELSDELRQLGSEDEITALATTLLCEHLDGDRCFIYRFYEGEDRMAVGPGYRRMGLVDLEGEVKRSQFPELLVPLEAGPFVVDDVNLMPAFSEARRQGLIATGIHSFVAVPLRKGPRNPIWGLAVSSAKPRTWLPHEVNLVTDVAERTWSAIARARAESALRESQEELRAELVDTRRLQEISLRLIEEDDIGSLYQQLIDAAASLMDAPFAVMHGLDQERRALGLIATRNLEDQNVDFWRSLPTDSATTCGLALADGTRAVVPDVEAADQLEESGERAALLACGIRSTQSTVLVSRGGYVVGMISTHWQEPGTPSERRLRLLDVLARQAADLIERRSSEEEMERVNRKLEKANSELARLNRGLERVVQERTEELTRSEVRFRQAFELGSVAACITNEDGDRLLEVNQAFTQLTGHAVEDALTSDVLGLELWPSRSDRELLAGAFSSGERFENLELKLRVKDGAIRDVEASGDRVRLNGTYGWLLHFLDVTDRKRSQEELLRAIQEVMADTTWFSRRLVERLSQAHSGPTSAASVEELSERERQVLTRVSRGMTNTEIADELGITSRTVRNHIANIYSKIEVHSRAEAVVWARERGLTT